ncbi:hypothetical protein ACFXDE_17555 [Kitasatospora sp. NPDC059408]|uniref:hypothetical protein n=1 Tax=Kitasatospora sp. NPDC059408 TaxID=3346823 RepID=UPI0036A7DEB8
MSKLRTALAAAVLGAAVVVPAVPAHAAAGTPEARVNTFFREYRRAVLDTKDQSPAEVRAHYLTAELNRRLDAWAQANDADPVFRAQNVPLDWSTRYEGSGAGHATIVLTEKWGGGTSQDVWYSVRLDTLVISDLEDPPVGS